MPDDDHDTEDENASSDNGEEEEEGEDFFYDKDYKARALAARLSAAVATPPGLSAPA